MKIAVITVFIFDKSKTFIFKPRCDCSVHRLTAWLIVYLLSFTARSVKHNAHADHVFGLSLGDKCPSDQGAVGREVAIAFTDGQDGENVYFTTQFTVTFH